MSRPLSRLWATNSAYFNNKIHLNGTHLAIRSFSITSRRRTDEKKNPAAPAAPIPESSEPTATSSEAAAPPPVPETAETSSRPRSLLSNLTVNSSSAQPSSYSEFRNPTPRFGPLPSNTSAARSPSLHAYARDTIAQATNTPTSAQLSEAANDENKDRKKDWGEEPFHFHVYSHKHNTHITVSLPDAKAIISVSTGNLGFKKSKRGSYDAAYQLCAHVMDKLNQGNWHKDMHKLEVVLRGYGSGREACTKVLLGNEGRLYRDKIVKVSDATRLKFGGTRSPKPRRLG